jgi:hypothetical protein
MVKKVKTKQRQKQRQKQSVIVNVNLAKHTAPRMSSSRPAHNRQQLPAPIYTSPIQGLVPQIFTKEGKQTSQPTIADQIEKYLESKQQPQQANVLGPIQSPALSSVKRASRIPLRISSESVELSEFETLLEENNAKRRQGRKPGSKNKEKINATEVVNSPEVFGVAEVISEPEYSDKKHFPDEFNREQTLLRPTQNMYSNNRFQPLFNNEHETLFNTPRVPEQPLGATINRTSKKSKKGSKLISEYEE